MIQIADIAEAVTSPTYAAGEAWLIYAFIYIF